VARKSRDVGSRELKGQAIGLISRELARGEVAILGYRRLGPRKSKWSYLDSREAKLRDREIVSLGISAHRVSGVEIPSGWEHERRSPDPRSREKENREE
jgi:hypothetical protein